MQKTDSEQALRAEFSEFVEATPAAPSEELDRAVLELVAEGLRPAPWKVLGKLTLIEVAAGLGTLTLCPQFGLGFGGHNDWLHGLHVAIPSTVFYLLCGVLFVSLGALLGGVLLNRYEVRAIMSFRNGFFAAYSVLAYLVLVALGPEVFVAGSLTWVLGAMLGNVLGYGAAIRMRHMRQAGSWQ